MIVLTNIWVYYPKLKDVSSRVGGGGNRTHGPQDGKPRAASRHPQPEYFTNLLMQNRKPLSEFDKALKAVLRVSKDDLKQMLEQEKRANAGRPKRGPKLKVVPVGQ